MRLVVNADDVGYCAERDRGMFECIEQGCVQSVSLMVNGKEAVSAAATLRRLIQQGCVLSVRLHLNLTEGRPIVPGPSSLTDSTGELRGKMPFREAWHAGALLWEDVEREVTGQCARFQELMGSPVRHLDSHQHTHQIPSLAEQLAPLCWQLGFRTVRMPHHRGDVNRLSPFLQTVHHQAIESEILYTSLGFAMPHAFIGLRLMGNGKVTCVQEELESVISRHSPDNLVVEWMCHPGYITQEMDDFSESTEREDELTLLRSTDLLALFHRYTIRVCPLEELLSS